MSEEETITVADVNSGPGGTDDIEHGTPVELPVVDILTGRGFVTGKSGSGKSNTASVMMENLLDSNFPVLVVDSDGEYYGLKEEYEVLHVGADEECDIQVSPEHAEKIASLALEQNVPIILDVSGYLEDDDAHELILETSRHLFAKEKKLKKPFLLVIEECHEYIPEKGGMGEAGKMLIKIGKRGRKHGLGILGISQRPADVKKDFITQCDWLVWHRLTWQNDTKVVGRILGKEYADAVEDLGDGEGFLVTDWSESIRRVQFHRKRTFDAGATPGLDDFERPELKSVSSDLVSELSAISDEKARRESELADLRQQLEKKEVRIHQLEQELEEARDLSRMADQFAQALLGRSEAPYRGGSGRNLARDDVQSDLYEYEDGDRQSTAGPMTGGSGGEQPEAAIGQGDDAWPAAAIEAWTDGNGTGDPDGTADRAVDGPAATGPAADGGTDEEPPGGESAADDSIDDDIAALARLGTVSREEIAEEAMRFAEAVELGTRRAVIEELTDRIAALPEPSLDILRHYRTEGESDPLTAHVETGGDADQQFAYSRHRPLRQSGVVRHVGRGRYRYAVPDLIDEAYAHQLDEDELKETVAAVESTFVPSVEDPRERRSDASGVDRGFVFDMD
ncbi:MAG: helicase HerA domain-containing protein [Halobacteriota archaeon]